MKDINNITIIGNLTKDPEFKTINGGNSVCEFSIAVGHLKDKTSFFNCVAWGKLGEIVKTYSGKGKKVCVNGYLEQVRWEKDGKTQSKINIVAENIQLLTPKTDGQPKQEQPTNYPTSVSYTDNTQYVDIEDDGIF